MPRCSLVGDDKEPVECLIRKGQDFDLGLFCFPALLPVDGSSERRVLISSRLFLSPTHREGEAPAELVAIANC